MPTPFPGMDPYLEHRGLWEEVHTGLIAEIQQFLAPLVRPRYRVAVERRAYLATLTNLVEIDLVRTGDPMSMRIAGNSYVSD